MQSKPNLTSISGYRDEILDLYTKTGSFFDTARILCERHEEITSTPNYIRSLVALEVDSVVGNQDYINEAHKAKKQKQRAQDNLRRERKVYVEGIRKENATEAMLEGIKENLQSVGKKISKDQRYSGPFKKKGACLVLTLSDLHLQAVINTGPNKFDFEIAAKRLQLLVQKTKMYGKAVGATRIVVALAGDNLKNVKRADEYLSQACNRTRAVVLAVHLLKQVLVDLRKDFYVDVFGVAGNESRVFEEIGWTDEAVTDNYDAAIFFCLEQIFSATKDKGMRFHPFRGNEQIFTIHNETFCLLHGHQIRATDQKAVQSFIGKYSTENVRVTHILCGHIHNTFVGSNVSRNASLCGGDPYAYNALGFASKASQNLHIVTEKGLDGVKLDCQDVSGVKGYDIMDELAKHNARSLDREVVRPANVPVTII